MNKILKCPECGGNEDVDTFFKLYTIYSGIYGGCFEVVCRYCGERYYVDRDITINYKIHIKEIEDDQD